MKTALVLVVLVAAVAVVAGEKGNCTTISSVTGDKLSVKTCPKCQWECLTEKHCTNITWVESSPPFNSVAVDKAGLATFNCTAVDPDLDTALHFSNVTESGGLCVLYADDDSFIGGIYDTQEQPCKECAWQCYTESKCTGITWNYSFFEKNETMKEAEYCPIIVKEEEEEEEP